MPRIKATRTTGNHHGHRMTAHANVTQDFGVMQRNPVALSESVAAQSARDLNQLLADTLTLRDLYKKHHWQAAGPMFYMIHLLFDKHFEEQNNLADMIAEHVQTLGGVTIAMAPEVLEATKIPRAPQGRESVPTQIARLVEAHGIVLTECREMAERADDRGDEGTNDLIVSDVIRTNELQAWFIDQHLR
jgi:starvation-inducible DNA-binding protein